MNSPTRLKVFIGPGGVGKTTLSSAMALKSSWGESESVKFITIDPSKRAKDFFGMKAEDSEKQVMGGLTASLNNRDKVFHDFIDRALKDESVKKKLKESKIFKALTQNLSVSQDFTSFYELWLSYQSKDYTVIVLDTPPLQNNADFLSGIGILQNLFDSSVFNFFIKDQKSGVWNRLIHKSQILFLELLKKLTGADFVDELTLFFKVLKDLQKELLKILKEVEMILNQHTDFYVVCAYNEISLLSLGQFLDHFKNHKYKIEKIFVNKSFDTENEREEQLFEEVSQNFKALKFSKVSRLKSEIYNLKSLGEHFDYDKI